MSEDEFHAKFSNDGIRSNYVSFSGHPDLHIAQLLDKL